MSDVTSKVNTLICYAESVTLRSNATVHPDDTSARLYELTKLIGRLPAKHQLRAQLPSLRAESGLSLQVLGLWGNLAKAALH